MLIEFWRLSERLQTSVIFLYIGYANWRLFVKPFQAWTYHRKALIYENIWLKKKKIHLQSFSFLDQQFAWHVHISRMKTYKYLEKSNVISIEIQSKKERKKNRIIDCCSLIFMYFVIVVVTYHSTIVNLIRPRGERNLVVDWRSKRNKQRPQGSSW